MLIPTALPTPFPIIKRLSRRKCRSSNLIKSDKNQQRNSYNRIYIKRIKFECTNNILEVVVYVIFTAGNLNFYERKFVTLLNNLSPMLY